jgi:hypothetical protein
MSYMTFGTPNWRSYSAAHQHSAVRPIKAIILEERPKAFHIPDRDETRLAAEEVRRAHRRQRRLPHPALALRTEAPRLSFVRRLWHDTFGWDPEEWHQ